MKDEDERFTQLVWIGLYRTSGTAPWVWSDQSKSVFRLWGNEQPNNYGGKQFCTAASLTAQWQDAECPSEYASVCYLVKKIYTVRLEVKSSQNVNDPAVKKEILLQIGKILKEKGMAKYAKLSWKIQPDENVFQKKIQSNITQQTCIF
ncbi:hypothetical protein G5714_008711 [Onychostoma macrolepis]|uniref:C-type lectin domain-containing protein n=1 Tax=Onychostoma macrolepis TaxID=369639 RepID=A0A7J6CWP9_9TELE|nr:hypothetical protein G5714_008711 [Onychostoma macrolepis]